MVQEKTWGKEGRQKEQHSPSRSTDVCAPADFYQPAERYLAEGPQSLMEILIGIRHLSKLRDLGWEGAMQTD